jgi:hypothetical protein
LSIHYERIYGFSKKKEEEAAFVGRRCVITEKPFQISTDEWRNAPT